MINAVSPRFAGVYAKINDTWYNITSKTEDKVTPAQVKERYEQASQKQGLFVSSNDVLVNFGVLIQTTITDLPVVLTDKDATKFNSANDNNQRRILNKWFDGLYIFNNVQTEKTNDLDLLI